ncbi:hypothetical protein [Streptomyces sp. MUSC 125]|uniref:hypothetical protein n=1 Tax=Streptomyces sp. MUSC 125 TaxID=1428624 RepID=UPI001F363C7D|nr:hypothetical protein [Streptomyces sp. MUSC 125]
MWTRYDKGLQSWGDEPWIAQNTAALLALLDGAGMAAPPGLMEELTRIGTAGGEQDPALTAGGTCPDNNLLTSEGLRLIDVEAACYQSVFLTAAYCRMPFSSCWCVFTLPAETAAEIEHAYRAEVAAVYPALAEDEVWQAGVRQATAVWTVDATARLLPRSVVDKPLHRTRRPVPTRRQVLRHRWELASMLEEFPALAETMRLLLRQVAGDWEAAPLPAYPAFGNQGAIRSSQASISIPTQTNGTSGEDLRSVRRSCSR